MQTLHKYTPKTSQFNTIAGDADFVDVGEGIKIIIFIKVFFMTSLESIFHNNDAYF